MAETKIASSDSPLNESNIQNGIPFVLPLVNDNSDGWGPNNQPEKYKDLPYQKFSKSDRIGKIADWASHQDKKNFKYQPQFSVGNVGQYSYFHDEDESQFTLVDQSRVNKNPYQKTKTRNSQNVSIFVFHSFFIPFNFNNHMYEMYNLKTKIEKTAEQIIQFI